MSNIERRELIQIALAGAFVGTVSAADKPPLFFTGPEYNLLEELCEVILPSDSEGPGAKAAGVRFYIDRIVKYSDSGPQQQWRAGLAALDSESKTQFGKSFIEADLGQRVLLVTAMAKNEDAPQTQQERFFATVKRMTFDGFAFSDLAKRDFFHYKGEHGVPEFSGCTHPEHKQV